MRPNPLIVAALVTLGVLTAPASATIAATSQHRSHLPRNLPRHHPIVPTQPQGQIACTEGGCQRIPAACTPVPGRTWRGTPTGYDVIVCPGR
jgi:hypothetical protein